MPFFNWAFTFIDLKCFVAKTIFGKNLDIYKKKYLFDAIGQQKFENL